MFHIKRAFTKAFTAKGRAGRLEYLIAQLFIIPGVAISSFIAIYFKTPWLFIIPLVLVVIIINLAFLRRKHDLGYGFWEWSFFINWKCSFQKGEDGPNKFGPPPEWEEKGITQ